MNSNEGYDVRKKGKKDGDYAKVKSVFSFL